MRLSPDDIVFWQYGFIKLNATILYTWVLMAVLVITAALVTRRLSGSNTAPSNTAPSNIATAKPAATKPPSHGATYKNKITEHVRGQGGSSIKVRSRWQNLLEIIVTGIENQIQEVGLSQPRHYLAFLGTIFLFVAGASISTIIPGYEPPTGSLSTTVALALCVFIAVPLFGIIHQGRSAYLKSYLQPTVIMLPFNVISEVSRTLALAIRLFGNMMSGSMILAILLAITPFIFPVLMTLLGLLTGMVQAYIFFILATVYIAAATRSHNTTE